MESSTAPAAGWFPDPGDPSTERWWSGDEWTAHTRQPLGAEIPEAFTAHVATLVAERPEQQTEQDPFVFAMTPTAQATDVAAAVAAEPAPAVPIPAATPAAETVTQPPERSWFTSDDAAASPIDYSSLPPVAPLTPPWLTPDPQQSAPEPSMPAQPAFTLTPSFAETAPAAPVFAEPAPQPVFTEPTPAPVFAAPVFAEPTPAPVFAEPTVAPAPAFATPAFTEPAPAPVFVEPTPAFAEPVATAPEFAAPSFAAPAPAPMQADQAAASGFVLPGVPLAPVTAADLEPRVGRHADTLPEPAPIPAPALPAVRPVGFTASADPDIANRYRSVIHAADLEELAAPAAAPAASSMASSTMRAARPTGPVQTFAAFSASNRAADAALRSGIGALVGVAIGFGLRMVALPGLAALAPNVVSLGSWVSGLVAIITGIVGLVIARRVGVGFGKALGGLLMGVFVSVLIPVGLVILVMMVASAFGLFSA